MIEKGKSVLLALLVALSLVQSYFLAYSMPYMDAKVKTELDYVKSELLGAEEKVDNLIFPEQMVLHMGNDRHTVFYPGTQPYYDIIYDKLRVREFKGIEHASVNSVDWDQVSREDAGVELRFSRAVPFELLQRVFKIDNDFLFTRDSIDRIWIYASETRDEVRTFFFSTDGRSVYEALRADLTAGDVEGYVGFGQYWDPYSTVDGEIYIPDKPINRLLEMQVAFSRYTAEQMQENLFVDPGITRAIQDRQFYTDGKRGLKIEPDIGWMSYTNTAAPTDSENDFIDNVMAAVSFVNQHGGWNGKHGLVQEVESHNVSTIRFQQYYNQVPIVSGNLFNFGYMQLTLQQGVVSTYDRSLLVLSKEVSNKTRRELMGGDELRKLVRQAEQPGRNVAALFPAYRPMLDDNKLTMRPVWAVRFDDGELAVLAESTALKNG